MLEGSDFITPVVGLTLFLVNAWLPSFIRSTRRHRNFKFKDLRCISDTRAPVVRPWNQSSQVSLRREMLRPETLNHIELQLVPAIRSKSVTPAIDALLLPISKMPIPTYMRLQTNPSPSIPLTIHLPLKHPQNLPRPHSSSNIQSRLLPVILNPNIHPLPRQKPK
jgi:hypothetical protein